GTVRTGTRASASCDLNAWCRKRSEGARVRGCCEARLSRRAVLGGISGRIEIGHPGKERTDKKNVQEIRDRTAEKSLSRQISRNQSAAAARASAQPIRPLAGKVKSHAQMIRSTTLHFM